MAKQFKKFDTSLELEVVRMIKEQGLIVQNVSGSMDIGPTAIRRWVTQYGTEQNGQPGICKPLTAKQQCIRVSSGCKLIHRFERMAAFWSGLEAQQGVCGNSVIEQVRVESAR